MISITNTGLCNGSGVLALIGVGDGEGMGVSGDDKREVITIEYIYTDKKWGITCSKGEQYFCISYDQSSAFDI